MALQQQNEMEKQWDGSTLCGAFILHLASFLLMCFSPMSDKVMH